MATAKNNNELFRFMVDKGCLKQKVYKNTLETLNLMRRVLGNLVKEYQQTNIRSDFKIPFEFKQKGDFELEVKFAGDILLFMMHTNVFEFPRDHFLHKTSYVKENSKRSFCGIINVYNFLADSLKYRRLNDVGYLIGRVFINKDMHFYIDGKKEMMLLPNNFVDTVIDEEKVREIIISAIRYTINFDLLVPPYDHVKEVSLQDIVSRIDAMTLKTGKRLGFKFQADLEETV